MCKDLLFPSSTSFVFLVFFRVNIYRCWTVIKLSAGYSPNQVLEGNDMGMLFRQQLKKQTVHNNNSPEMEMCVFMQVPGHQDALILLQLFHKGGVRFGHSSTLLHVFQGFLQIPAVLLHGVGDHCGRRATYTHLTVHQALGSNSPAADSKYQTHVSASYCPQSLRQMIQVGFPYKMTESSLCDLKLTWLQI